MGIVNQRHFLFRKHNTSLCLFCNLNDEFIHLFVHYSKTTKELWCTVIEYFKRNLHILLLPPQIAIFGILEADDIKLMKYF